MSTFRRGNIWWYEFEFRGARVRESSNSKNRDVAGRIERERRRNLELGIAGLKRIGGPLTVSRAVSALIEDRKGDWGERTVGIHENSWRHLKPHFGKLLLQDIQPKHISRYQRERRKQKASGRTINIEVGLIRMVMVKHRIWQNISPDVHMLREREDVGRALGADEEKRILAAAKESISRALYPALLTSLHTGLRLKELRLSRWRQIDFLKEEIRVGRSKTVGGEGRVIPLSATALACLKEWHSLFPDGKPDHFVFPKETYKQCKQEAPERVRVSDCDPTKPIGSWKTAWKTCRKRAAVSCRWHDGRHTFISRCGDNQVSDQTLMAMTGQLSRKTLERYSHARMEAKRAAVRGFDKPEPQGSPQFPPQSEKKEGEVIQ